MDTQQDPVQNTDTTPNDIDVLKQELEETNNNWKRALADYKNLEKRVIDEREALTTFASSLLISKIIPVLDNLEMVAAHSTDEGLKLTIKEFVGILKSEGLVELEVVNKDFDANTMEAIDTVEGEKNKTVEVVQKGYMFKDKLLRPARVKVGQGDIA